VLNWLKTDVAACPTPTAAQPPNQKNNSCLRLAPNSARPPPIKRWMSHAALKLYFDVIHFIVFISWFLFKIWLLLSIDTRTSQRILTTTGTGIPCGSTFYVEVVNSLDDKTVTKNFSKKKRFFSCFFYYLLICKLFSFHHDWHPYYHICTTTNIIIV